MATRDRVDAGPKSDPFGIIAGDYRRMVEVVESLADYFDLPSLEDTCQEVLSLPPEERFTRSADVFVGVYGIKEDEEIAMENVDAGLASILDVAGGDALAPRLLGLLQSQLAEAQQNVLDRVLVGRGRAEESLILAVFLERLNTFFDDLGEFYAGDVDVPDTRRHLSVFAPILCRFVLIARGEQSTPNEEMLRDLLRSKYHYRELLGEQPEYDPGNLDAEVVRNLVIEEGAVLAYEKLPISVARGAELAGVDRRRFEELLLDRGIRPRYGPGSGDELREGSGPLGEE